jgi:hypothetical protein
MQNKNRVNPVADESDEAAFVVADIEDDAGVDNINVGPTLPHVRKIAPGCSFHDSAPTD